MNRIAAFIAITTLSSGALPLFGSDDLPALSPSTLKVIEVKTEAFARQLVELKLQEVVLQTDPSADAVKLKLNQAQQAAVRDEITKIALAPLEARMTDMLSVRLPSHAEVEMLKREIAMTRMALGSK